MPGSVNLSSPTGVLPASLCTSFTEKRNWESRFTEYHDGSRQSCPLVSTSRKAWTLKKRLTPVQVGILWTFWKANQHTAFHFYDPMETAINTNPGSNYDPTGVSLTGRYTVRFNGDWSQTSAIARTDLSLDLLEIA